MTVRCLSFIAPVFLLTAGQVSSHLSQVRLLSLKIFDLFLDVGQEMVDLLNRDREPSAVSDEERIGLPHCEPHFPGEETTRPRPVASARSLSSPSTLIPHRVVGGLRHNGLPVRLALR